MMNDLHAIGVTEEFRHQIEAVGAQFIEQGTLRARNRTWEVLAEIRNELKLEMTEVQAREKAKAIFADHGVKKHWHQPVIRFGAGTVLSFHQPLRSKDPLKEGDLVHLDLGPVWADAENKLEYEGDVGDSFVFGEDAEGERCVNAIHTLFGEAKAKWQKEQCTGKEMYALIEKRAAELGYRFLDNVVGHRVADFPHQRFSKQELPKMEFKPAGFLWILELQIVHPELPLGAFYEDLLF